MIHLSKICKCMWFYPKLRFITKFFTSEGFFEHRKKILTVVCVLSDVHFIPVFSTANVSI